MAENYLAEINHHNIVARSAKVKFIIIFLCLFCLILVDKTKLIIKTLVKNISFHFTLILIFGLD